MKEPAVVKAAGNSICIELLEEFIHQTRNIFIFYQYILSLDKSESRKLQPFNKILYLTCYLLFFLLYFNSFFL